MTVALFPRLLVMVALVSMGAPALAVTAPAAPVAPDLETSDDPYQIVVSAERRSLDPVLAVQQEKTGDPGLLAFAAYTNYAAVIDRAEIRLFKDGDDPVSAEPLAVVALDGQLRGEARLPGDFPEGAQFVLRAYGRDGGWDETRPHLLEKRDPAHMRNGQVFVRTDEALHRSIPLPGIALTARGRAVRGQVVSVNGVPVPLGPDGRFAAEQIVPSASGIARVEVREDGRAIMIAERNYDANRNRWFVVAQGDMTFSHAVANGPAVAVSGDPLAQGDHLTSRGAFYAKGIVGRDYRVTASLDTGETLLKDMFSNLDRKDPGQLLRRLDDRYHYPTFGDGSTITEDAPSQGRFYVRVQKDDSNLIVGNFITAAQGTELVQLDRGLFGVMLDYKSRALTSHGERRRQVFAFASNPGTITASDELRGTGGSLFYLRHQDITVGSERVRLEVRSPQTGAVLSSSPLRLSEDYEIDYYQGRITLLRPLSSYLPNEDLVRAGALAGNVPVLVARYEYSPPEGTISGHSLGGRAAQWISDWLRLGITGQSETAAPADQLVLGSDVLLSASDGTWLKGEYGRTDGPGFALSSSLDGGLNFLDAQNFARVGQMASAYRIEGALDERDLDERLRGKASGYFEDYEAGYAAMGRITPNAMRRWGAKLDQQLGGDARLALAYEGREDVGIGSTDLARGEWTLPLSPTVSLRTGLRYEEMHHAGFSGLAQGRRLDGGIEATYARIGADWSVRVFGQTTLVREADRKANDRGGMSGKWNITPTLAAEGEVSQGSGGWAANALLSRRGNQGSETHIGYRLYADATDHGYDPQELMTQPSRGMLVVGSQQRLSHALTMTAEEKYAHGGSAPSLTHAYGLRFSPDQVWSLAGSIEHSTVFEGSNSGAPGIRRMAATLSASYDTSPLAIASAVEYRRDDQGGNVQTSWLFRDNIDVVPDASWHLLGRFEYAFTDVSGASLQAADYTRLVVGAAYRPVSHDQLNILTRFTYFRDLGPAGQIMTNGGVEQPRQVSQVISLDASYELASWFTLGGKYAWRQGRVSLSRASDTFVNSAASLYALRGDVRFTRDWDVLIEGRLLQASLAHDNRTGLLAAVYRRLGKVKLGLGYNFADYSSDLTDQSYSTKGVFVNLLAAF